MRYELTLHPAGEFSQEERAGLSRMKTAVYPPEEFADDPVRKREWLAPMWGVLVTDPNGDVVSYTGVVVTEGTVDGEPRTIGGVGGIATHPAARGLGLAARGIDMALTFMEERGVDFALLVCRDALVDYYANLGWRRFDGTTLDRQFGDEEEFTFNEVMVKSVNSPAPTTGTIDVAGPLW